MTGAASARFGYLNAFIKGFNDLGYSVTVISADKKQRPSEIDTSYGKLICLNGRFVKMPIVDLPFGYLVSSFKEVYDFYFVIAPSPVVAAYLLKKMGKKVIYWISDDSPSLFAESLSLAFPKLKFLKKTLYMIYKRFEEGTCNNFDSVVTSTTSLKIDRKHYRTKIYSIAKCISPTFSRAIKNPTELVKNIEGKVVIAYVGEISKSKGLKTMLEVFSLVAKDIPNTVLLMVGDFINTYSSFEDRIYFNNYIDNTGLKDKILITGWVAEDEIPSYLAHAHVGLVLFDAWCYSYMISVPDKLIDMLACGLPVVVSDSLIEVKSIIISANCGLTVDPKDIRSVTDSIISILKNDGLRTTMARNAKQYTNSSRSYDKFKKELETIIFDTMT